MRVTEAFFSIKGKLPLSMEALIALARILYAKSGNSSKFRLLLPLPILLVTLIIYLPVFSRILMIFGARVVFEALITNMRSILFHNVSLPSYSSSKVIISLYANF